MPIRTSKSKIERKIQMVNNIHRQIQLLTAHSMQEIICHISDNQRFHTSPSCDIPLRHTPRSGRSSLYSRVRTQPHDMPGSESSFTTCPSRKAVLRHVMVGTQLLDMPGSKRSFTACPGRDAVDSNLSDRRSLFGGFHHVQAGVIGIFNFQLIARKTRSCSELHY